MSNLLLDDEPLIVLPSLAEQIGLNESIVLQQLHYWLRKSNNFHEGYKWIYNTYEDWQKQFPFWSVRTLKRIITGLENNEFIITGNFNKLQIDRTKWYRINYQKLDALMERPEGQNGTSIVTSWHDGGDKLAPPLPEITTENTTEITTKEKDIIPFSEIIAYLNEKTQANYKASSKKTKDLISTRWKEGFTLEDFKTVIDKKTADWLKDKKMSVYLRPETLFGTKFESYLNQKGDSHAKSQFDFEKDGPEYDFGF